MKRLIFIFLISLLILEGFSQNRESITLSMLYKAIEQNHPLNRIKPAMDSSTNLQIKNLNSVWLPKLDANATATWQSDVIEFNIPFPGITIPSPDADQYKLTLDATQVIWDGGATKSRKSLVETQSNAEKSTIDNELYGLRERVNDAFFGIILLEINENQMKLMRDELESRLGSLESGVREGMMLQSSLFSIQAEILRLNQRLMEIPSKKSALITALESITGLTLGTDTNFLVPELIIDEDITLFRPEIEGFALQKKIFDSRIDLASKRRMPTLGAFATAGYGKPGLNMLNNEWDTYLVVGARFSWNIWDWNSTSREKQQLKAQQSIIDYRKQIFLDAVNSQITNCLRDIETINQQLVKDEEIVGLLDKVKDKSASQLANGTISSSEYLTDFNSAARAKLDMEYRKVLLVKEKVKLNHLRGKTLE